MMQNLPVHPDDLLFFNEVADVMRTVAKNYKLPLRSIVGHPMPKKGLADRFGNCEYDGNISLVLRFTEDGEWCDAPISPDEVWDTAAHELAHLRHFDHSPAWEKFYLELLQAVKNQQVDHTQKVIQKLIKLQAAREGEAKLGNEAAAEAFAGMINKMLVEYELNPSDLDYARATDNDPVIEVPVELSKYGIPAKKTRIAWEESLARVVAKAHLCSFLIRPGSNRITFVGTKSHALVAEYAYGTLVPATNLMARRAYVNWEYKCRHEDPPRPDKAAGYKEAWLASFVHRIEERFAESRKEVMVAKENSSTSLIRLNGALVKVQKYIDNKYRGSANPLSVGGLNNSQGRSDGRAAANKMVLGRRGVDAAPVRGQLGGK